MTLPRLMVDFDTDAECCAALELLRWPTGVECPRCQSKSISRITTRKHTERHVDDSFHNYIYRAFSGQIPRNEYLRVRWHRIGDMIGTRLFGEPLDHSADAGPVHRRRRRRGQ